MTVIAHLSDLHLGLTRFQARAASRQNQREVDFQHAADVVADHLINVVKPDLVLYAGDTLDKFHIGTAAELAAVRCFRRQIDAGLPVVLIGGNHDHPQAEGAEISLGHLRERGVDVHLSQTHRDVAGVRVHLVPYRTLSRFYSGRHELAEFQFSDTLPNVLVAHGYAAGEGVTYPPEPVVIPPEWLADPRFALVCLGHVHDAGQIAPRVFYGGALERLDFDEVDVQPGFWLHTIDDHGELAKSERVLVADLGVEGVPRPMRRVTIDADGKTLDQLNAEVEPLLAGPQVAGSLLSLHVLDVSVEFNRRNTRTAWEARFRASGGTHIEIEARTRRVIELLDVKFAALPKNLSKAFEGYLHAQPLSDDERGELLDAGLEVLAVAHDHIAREAVK